MNFSVSPSISSLSPGAAAVGVSITVTGNNFGATQGTINFNGTAATPTSWSATQIVVPVPAGATTGNVVVTAGGFASNGVAFTVVTGGYLAGRVEMTPFSYSPDYSAIDFSDPEIIDWVHLGLSGSGGGFDRKNGGSLISSLTVIGPDAAEQYSGCIDHFTWTNGQVTSTTADACSGLGVTRVGDAFQFTVPADTTPKTLRIYLGSQGATGTLQASLSDYSAVPYSDTTVLSDGIVAGTYSIDFRATAPGQTLTVTYTATNVEYGGILFEGIALTPKHPDIAIIQPTVGATFGAPASFTANVQAAEVAGTINSVSLSQDGAVLGTLGSSPFNFALSNLGAGNYQFTAGAIDANGRSQVSLPVYVHVVGSGGELAASASTPPGSVDLTTQGTADWVLLGRQSTSAVDRKANVAPLIGLVSRLNWAYWYNYSDNAITYSAEDGTQQFTPATCGIFSPNPASGFEFTINAGLTERTANIYIGAYRGQGKFEAYLSDGSAPVFVDTSTDSGTANGINHVYSLRYHAASEGQKLIIRYTLLTNRNYGNVTLQAVTVDGAPRQSPSITSVSHASDPRGTLIWIYGGNFGTALGTVLFNGVPAQVLYWSNTSIEVSVPPGATSGPIVVSTDGASSNGLNFTVTDATPPGPPATIAPAQVSLFVGDTRKFQALDSSGRPTTASSWTSSDTSIADFGPDPNDPTGPPILTAKVPGQVTINADSATATVTVYPEGTSFPAGTVLWSVPSASTGGGSGAFSVQAMPAPTSLADLFIVQPSGLVQALKADGTPVWNASFGVNASHALPDPSGGIIGFDTASAPMTRIDSSGSPTWSIPPADYNYRAENIAVHPDGTIFILGTLKNPPEGASTLTYVIGINGLTGAEKFRVPVMTSEQVPNMVLEDVQPSTVTIAPDGNAYLEHVVETGSRTQQNFDVSTIIDSTSTASLRIMKIASDGTYVDNEIESWSSSYHEDDEFSDSGATEVATYSFSPAQLPEFSLKEIIPDNHGNLLASWSYWVPSWTQTCTTTGRNSQQQSTTCSGPVPGQDPQAHVGLLSLLTGINLVNDFILSGVDYFTGPMVMGQLDTAFATGAKNADNLNRIAAFNAVSGQPSWSRPGTADSIEPVGATADGGITVKDFPNAGGNVSVIRYDSNGNPSSDPALSAIDLQYFASDAWMTSLPDGSQTLVENAALDWALSPWDSPRGPQRPDSASDPRIKVTVRVYEVDEAVYGSGEIAAKVNTAHDLWFKKSKISLNWDSTITTIPGCNRSKYPFGCTPDQDLDSMCGSAGQLSDLKTALQNSGADFSKGVNLTFTGAMYDKCQDGQPFQGGYTPYDHTANRYVNYGIFAESGDGNVVAHETGHMFQLKHYTPADAVLVDPYDSLFTSALVKIVSSVLAYENLMCGPAPNQNPICPTLPNTDLDSVQINSAEKGAASLKNGSN